MKRKLLSVLLTFCLAFSLLPTAALADEAIGCAGGETCSHQAAIGSTHYDTLKAAVDAAATGQTVTLLKDAELTETLDINKAITLDGANHKITGVFSTEESLIKVQTDGDFTLTNCIFAPTTKYAKDTAGARTAVYLKVGGNATVTNNTFEGVDNGYRNAIEFGINDDPALKGANISGNTFKKTIQNNYFNFYNMAEGAVINITNNQFLLANKSSNGIRISNNKNVSATFNLDPNTYTYAATSADSVYEGLILLQDYSKDAGTQDFTKITINITNLTSPEDANQILYVYDDQDHIIQTNQPVVKGDSSIEKFFVAKVGDTSYYKTLPEAIAAAQDGDTITLLKDVDENVTIPAGKSITLDLNGKTINGGTGTSSAAITNYGTVTITDSSTEKAGTIKRSDIGTEGETSYYVIRNLGKMTITTANVINNSGYAKTNPSGSMVGSSLICNGDGDAPATLTINGGAFEQQNFIVVKNGSFGILNVNGGKFTSKHSAIQNWYKADIKGGEINGQLWTDAWQEGSSVGETKIGGTAKFTGEILMDITGSVKPTLEISGGEMIVSNWRITLAAADKGAKPVVTGGNFSQPVKREYLDSSLNAELKRASGKTPYSYYTSMDDALAAAKPGDTVTDLNAATEQKVTLTLKYNDGATADTTYNVASGKTITLPTPAHRSGYTFNGWYDSSKFYAAGASYTVSATVTLNASWSYISSGSSSYDPTYSVSTPSKTEHGSVTVSPKNASKGDTVTVTVKPDSGYVLETLTVTDKNGNELTLKDKGNGKYTFTMPAGKVEVKATFMEDNSMLNFFYDVPNNAYFYEAVKWAVENGITTGVGNDLFAPEQPCTRAQIVTFLWRAAGSPEPKSAASGMTDVVSGSYYEKAVAWAIENGITTGTTTTTFSPDATCTRAQAVTFLARALKAKAASAAEFSDVPNDSYFADAVAWAAANGVTEGIGGGLFGSDNDCTRGQIVTFLYRAYNK